MAEFEAEKTKESEENNKGSTTEGLRESLHDSRRNEHMSGDILTRNSLKRRERRHVYQDIAPLKTDPTNSHSDCVNGCEEGTRSRMMLVKPELPPKPKYILRDKLTRHVYQSIHLPNTGETASIPPPLPIKPPCLQRLKLSPVETPPPLPPRVLNQQAIQQRQRLDHEYFENLRKSVDEELLGLVEENDLPVPLNLPITHNMQSSRFQYGAHSPPLDLSNTSEDYPTPAPRRHSLPLREHSDHEMHHNNETHLMHPARLGSSNWDAEARAIPETSKANLAYNFILLKRCGWYWGNMNWQEAEELLSKNATNGAFLVRDSQDSRHLLTITVRSTTNTLHHIRVEYCEGKFQLYEAGGSVSQSTAQCVRHSNIQQFVNLAVKHSISGSFLYFLKPRNMGEPPVQIQLLTPTSRFAKVKTLKYICRLTIREIVVADLIAALPVPPSIQQYLKAGPYYDANEEQDCKH